MIEPVRAWVSPEEYLELELKALDKHEYFNGEIFAMSGAGFEHNQIVSNLLRELGNQFEGTPCQALPSDLRVKVSDTGLYTYPDVVVVCGEPTLEKPGDTLVNPKLIVEVLSPSTESYDRNEKFAHYRRLESLQEYVLVSSEQCHLEVYRRAADPGHWVFSECSDPSSAITLESIGCTLAVSQVYSRVRFPEPAPGSRRGPWRLRAASEADEHD